MIIASSKKLYRVGDTLKLGWGLGGTQLDPPQPCVVTRVCTLNEYLQNLKDEGLSELELMDALDRESRVQRLYYEVITD